MWVREENEEGKEEEMMTKLGRKENKWNFKMCFIVNDNRIYAWSIFFFLQGSVTVDSHTGTQHKIDFWLLKKKRFKAIGPCPSEAWTKVGQFASSFLSSFVMPIIAREAQPGFLLITSLKCQAWESKWGQCNYSHFPSLILLKSHGYSCHHDTVIFDNTFECVQTYNG